MSTLEYARYAFDIEWSNAESSTGFPIAFALVDMQEKKEDYARLIVDPWECSAWTCERVVSQWKNTDTIVKTIEQCTTIHHALSQGTERVVVADTYVKAWLQQHYPVPCKIWVDDFDLNDVQRFRAQLMLTNWADTQGYYHALKDAQGLAFSYSRIYARPD